MSDLTIKNAGVTVTPKSPGSSISTGKRRIIRVTPTLDTSAYSTGDVLFNYTEIPNAVREDGGCSKLINVTILNTDDAMEDMELLFHQVSGINIGTVNSSPDISDANAKLLKVCSVFCLDASGGETFDMGGAQVSNNQAESDNSNQSHYQLPIFLQAEPGSTSVYFSAMVGATETYLATDLTFIFHIEY